MKSAEELQKYKRAMKRKKATPAEKKFAARLHDAGIDFVRQCIVGFYIVDFVIPRRMLVVELDGSSHVGRERYDANRDTWLKTLGFEIVRLPNASAGTWPLTKLDRYERRKDGRPFRSALATAQSRRSLAIIAERKRLKESETLAVIQRDLDDSDARYQAIVGGGQRE